MSKKTPKRTQLHVVPALRWLVREDGREVASVPSKAAAVARAIARAKRAPRASVRIHNRGGQITEERTYPRASDPRTTKG